MAAPSSDPAFLPKQAAFIAEYLIDAKATAAAIRAGYAEESASVDAQNLLRNQRIVDAIKRGQAQRLARVNLKADEVVVELASLAFSNINHYVVSEAGEVRLAEGAPENAMAAIQSVQRKTTVKANGDIQFDVTIKLWDKPGALKLMGKHANVAACFDSVRLTGPNGGPIEAITEVRRVIVRSQPESDVEQPPDKVEAVH